MNAYIIKVRRRYRKSPAERRAFDSFFVFVNLWIDEEEVVYLQSLLWADGALIASEDVLGIDVADHGVDEGILDAVPGQCGNVGISGSGSGDRTDA